MGKILFGGSPSYNIETYRIFSTIEVNPVGRVILTSVRQSAKTLSIEPYTGGDCNSNTKALDPFKSAPAGIGAFRRQAGWFKGDADNPATRREDERFNQFGQTATGGGSDVRVGFSPDKFRGPSACFDGKYGSAADEALLHELVHAARYMRGLSNAIPTDDNSLAGYDNEEEFLAVVTTNVYLSAKGSTQLRAHHAGHTALHAPLNTSAGFLADKMNWKVLNIARLTWMTEFLALSRVTSAQFNPFRELSSQLRNFPVGNMVEVDRFPESAKPAR
jgi:hypothetical protein